MRLKLDENLGRRWAEQLRLAGHDVHTVHDEGLAGAADRDVIAAAVDERRVLVTMDLDFANPMRFPPGDTAGVVVLRDRRPAPVERPRSLLEGSACIDDCPPAVRHPRRGRHEPMDRWQAFVIHGVV